MTQPQPSFEVVDIASVQARASRPRTKQPNRADRPDQHRSDPEPRRTSAPPTQTPPLLPEIAFPANHEEPPEPYDWLDSTEDSTYDPHRFYVATSFYDEGSGTVSAAISKSILAQIEAIVEQRRFPDVATKADVIRDAVFHWLHARKDLLPPHLEAEIAATIKRHQYLSWADQQRRWEEEGARAVEQANERFGQALSAKDEPRFLDAIAKTEAAIPYFDRKTRGLLSDQVARARQTHERTDWE